SRTLLDLGDEALERAQRRSAPATPRPRWHLATAERAQPRLEEHPEVVLAPAAEDEVVAQPEKALVQRRAAGRWGWRVEHRRRVAADRAPHLADEPDASADHDQRARHPEGEGAPRRGQREIPGHGREHDQDGQESIGDETG